MATFHSFVVEGRGQFPFDMLRYDACWPADGESAAQINCDQFTDRRATRTVHLISNRAPTPARWSSFMWGCGQIQKTRWGQP